MLFNIEIAQTYSAEKKFRQNAFYKSMLKSFEEAIAYITKQGLTQDFLARLEIISNESSIQNWCNSELFEGLLKIISKNKTS